MTRRGRAWEGCACGSGRAGAAARAGRVSLAGLREEDALFMEAGGGCWGNGDAAISGIVVVVEPIKARNCARVAPAIGVKGEGGSAPEAVGSGFLKTADTGTHDQKKFLSVCGTFFH